MMRFDRTKGRPEPVHLLDQVREEENGEPLVDFRVACPRIVMFRETVIPYVRQGVAERLNRAAEALPEGLQIGVTDAWRALERQRAIYEQMTRWHEEYKPGLGVAQRKRAVNRWVAPWDRKAPPGHCTGAAVDVVLLDAAGEMLDVTSPYDRLGGAPTFVYGLTTEAEANRLRLYEAMVGAGFSNCRDEWWHYSYGDAGWAVRLGFEACVYGLAELPETEWRAQQTVWLEAFLQRENPFLAGR